MGFRLNLGFGGLVLFVPEFDSYHHVRRMHVLMPAVNDHVPALLCDQLEGYPEGYPRGSISPRIYLVNSRITLTGSSYPRLTGVPAGVADLGDGCPGVSVDLIDDDYQGGAITSRVTFSHGVSSIVPCGAGAHWDFRGKVGQLAIRLVWEIDIEADELVVDIQGINESQRSEQHKLKPDASGQLDLWVFHSPSDDLDFKLPPRTKNTTPPSKGYPAHHFDSLLKLAGCYGDDERLIPSFYRAEYLLDQHFPSCYGPFEAPGTDLMCIGATAPLKR